MIFTSLFSIARVFSVVFFLHPVHISVTEIEFDEKEKTLEIMMRVFMDDMETTLRNSMNKPELDVFDPKNAAQLDQLMPEYLKSHFQIALDDKIQKTVYLGHEREPDVFIFYIEVSNVKKWKTIRVLNDIITDTYDDQSNLVHVSVGEKVRSLRLTKDTPADKLTFDSK